MLCFEPPMNALLCAIFFLALQQPPTPKPAPDPCDENCRIAQQNLRIARNVELFTGGSVLVGFIQAGTMIWQGRLSRRTLAEVHTQAGHMERQTVILEKSVAVAQASADAAMAQITMMKQKERARLRVSFAPVNLGFSFPSSGFPLSFTVNIDGTTRAQVLESSITSYIRTEQEEKQMNLGYMDIPEVITPEMTEVNGETIVMTTAFPRRPETDQKKFVAAANDGLYIFVEGRIRYKVFGDVWLYSFQRRWENGIMERGRQITPDHWEETGEQENNETSGN